MKTSTTGRLRVLRCVAILAAVCIPLLVSPAFADDLGGIVFFGDSLSDPGNHFEEFGIVSRQPFVPDPEYPYAIGGHHFSNGLTWAEQLATRMKLPTSGKPALRQPRLFTNYAVGRARARANAPVFPFFDLSTQVGQFLADFGGQASPDNLYALWIGSNDLNDALRALYVDPTGQASYAILNEALTAVGVTVQALWLSGARTFLIVNLPNIAITPYVRALGPAAQGAATQLSTAYNTALAGMVNVLSAALPGSRFINVEVNAIFAALLANPKAAGLTNVQDSCLAFGVVGRAICSTPNRYLFWDGVHPTTTGHGFVAEAALLAIGTE